MLRLQFFLINKAKRYPWWLSMEIQHKLIEFMNNNNNNNNNNLCQFTVSYFCFHAWTVIMDLVCIAMKSAYHLRHVLLCVCLSVRASLRLYRRGFNLTHFHTILYWEYPWKYVYNSKSENIGQFTWRPKYVSLLRGT